MRAFLLAARPKTLPAAIAPVVAGTALGAQLAGQLHLGLSLIAFASCLCLQIATNLFNDAIDHAKGADTKQRLGPRRITASGDLSSRQVHTAAFITLILATLLALPLFSARGWPILAFGLPSLYLCYGYTGGPVPLAYRGLGDVFVLIFFGWVAVIGSCFLQTAAFDLPALLLGTQIGLLSTTLIAINNLRDRDEDRQTGKHTLAVQWGVSFARIEIACCLLGPTLLGLLWLRTPFALAAWWPILALPLALLILHNILTTLPSPRYNVFLALSALHLLLFTGLLMIGLLA
jgi:1,4-dihydroxy-2-naphthoate octaprenyltransferase